MISEKSRNLTNSKFPWRAIEFRQKEKKANENINKNHKLIQFIPGDLVLVKALRVPNAKQNEIAKFFDLYEGPFKIEQKFGPTTYLLQDVDVDVERGKFHVNNLKRYVPRS